MLLEFKTKNYKSFKEEMCFSMIPAQKQKGLDYSILKQKVGRKIYKSLCSAVIYGPNAAGKTNIIGALDTLKNIVNRGHINNVAEPKLPNIAAMHLELIPNNILKQPEVTDFVITFIQDDLLIEYGLALSLGLFLDISYDRKITKEYLKINGETVFERTEKLKIGSLKSIKKYLIKDFEKNHNSAVTLAQNGLNRYELFLVNGFKTTFSAKLVSIIMKWFGNQLKIFYQANFLQGVRVFPENKENRIYIDKIIDAGAKAFGINSNSIAYKIDRENPEATLCSLFENSAGKNEGQAIPADSFESYGTLRFINLFPLVLHALIQGCTLIVDEFDASIHPMAIMSLINIFHNDEINIKNAQLIFNTQNPIFLNSSLFRRDEIKFVDRDDETYLSSHYSLSDFGTVGEKGVRKNEAYMKNYFIDRYGAIRDIDFEPIVRDALGGEAKR